MSAKHRSHSKSPLATLESIASHGDSHASPTERLSRLLNSERHDLWIILIYAVVIGVFSLAIPVAVQALVNTVAFGSMLQPVVVLTLLLLSALIFEGTLRVLQTRIVEILVERIFVRVAVDLGYRLSHVRKDAFIAAHGPEVVNRFFDVVNLQKAAAALLVDGLALALQTLLGLMLIAFYNPWLLAFDLVLFPLIIIVLLSARRRGERTSIEESKAKYNVAAWLEEMARHPTTFRSVHSSHYAIRRIDDLTYQYLKARRSHFKILIRQIIGTHTLRALGSAALLGVGGWLVIQRQLTLGQLVAAELIVGAVLAGVSKFGKHLETYYDLVASIDKLGHLVDLPLEQSGHEHVPQKNTGLSIHMRNLSYTVHERPLLHSINWTLTAGSKVALSGASGVGKTSLVDLIFGLEQPTSGSIEVDGYDIRDLSLLNYRSHISIVREAEVFEGTLLENIQVGRPEIALETIQESLAQVGLLDEIRALPNGLQTHLTTGGSPLSQGQISRLMIARAIVSKPRLLVIDEVLDSLHPEGRVQVLATVFREDAPWTLLVVTHDQTIARMCDYQYRLENGELIRTNSLDHKVSL